MFLGIFCQNFLSSLNDFRKLKLHKEIVCWYYKINNARKAYSYSSPIKLILNMVFLLAYLTNFYHSKK